MKIEKNPWNIWEIKKDGELVSIAGRTGFESFEELATIVQAKGLHVWGDGSIHRDKEPGSEVTEDPVEALSAAQDAEAKKKARSKAASEKRKERYNNDPEYREKILQYQRDRRKNKKDST